MVGAKASRKESLRKKPRFFFSSSTPSSALLLPAVPFVAAASPFSACARISGT